ncbi:efflux RND transporter periplasmic adaptor subunit [Roseiconus lacunae]|uniref:efflux RND transporter periplasmic adaptor subunit n=1 Tax=Roseiconus lacunae TaxID=2605694 RepID=UPI001E337BAC|nr:hypothetical protein [Roseiconus lacunae]MCD0463725.1 hypothetical protein [Roseiconus lacunae]
MSRTNRQRVGLRTLYLSLGLTGVFAFGSASGTYLASRRVIATEHDDHHGEMPSDHGSHTPQTERLTEGDASDHDDDHDHVALTKQAFENLGLQLGPIPRRDYWKSRLVPAIVTEIPGQSDLSISAPVTGVVENVRVLPGQSLRDDQPMFVIRLTDEALIESQSKLLGALTRQEVIDQELRRLTPLRETGVVSGVKTRELEYELKQLRAQQAILLQEVRSRGLPQSSIDGLLKERTLATAFSVFPPEFIREQARCRSGQSTGFSVENLVVHPGKSVSRGDALCSIAYHSDLYLEGTAFEDDLPILNRVIDHGWNVTASFHDMKVAGVSHLSHLRFDGHSEKLNLLRVDNHIDERTQTIRFFVELPNRVTSTREVDGRIFEQWRFRPGQRIHLRLPVQRLENQLQLPVDAVVVDGPNVYVFAKHREHGMSTAASVTSVKTRRTQADTVNTVQNSNIDIPHDRHDDVFIEFEPIPVRLLHRDDQTAVIAIDRPLEEHDSFALNNANKLYLALKIQQGSSGGHHHHDH